MSGDKDRQAIPHHATLPIIAITLFFSYWFAEYSYETTFGNLVDLSTGKSLTSYYGHISTWTYPVSIICLGLILWPSNDNSVKKWSTLAFLSFTLFILKDIQGFPLVANHGMMMLLLAIGYFIIVFSYLLKGQISKALTQMDYLGLMRMFLLIMYFFGTFHKINSDFLHNEGCWRVFYDTIPFLPDFLLRPEIAVPLGGYGTLILESAAIIMLFFPKTKYYGMLLGMSFHFVIGVAGTGTVAHFSAFAFALHMSFLSTDSITQFKQSRLWLWLNKTGKGHILIRIPFALFLVITVYLSSVYSRMNSNAVELHTFMPFLGDIPHIHLIYAKTMWFLYSVPVLAFVLLYGRTPQERPAYFLRSQNILANAVSVLLILNSITPYIGLKSSTDLAMFSNLRTEWGETNHYWIPKLPYIFPYLGKEYYVRVIDSYRHKKPIDEDSSEKAQNTWIHIFMLHSDVYNRTRLLSDEQRKGKWLKYMDSNGQIHYVDATQKDHFLLQEPGWWTRNYLNFVAFVDVRPIPCESR